MKIIISFFMIVFLANCNFTPEFLVPNAQIKEFDKNDEFIEQNILEARWWRSFNDEALDEIMHEAANNNYDILIAKENIATAINLRKSVFAEFFPKISGSLSRNKVNSGPSYFDAALDVSWQIDLFGKIKNSDKSAKAQLAALEEEEKALRITILAELARNYFELRYMQQLRELTLKEIKLLQQQRSIAEVKYKNGLIDKAAFLELATEYNMVAAELPDIETKIRSNIYNISVLAGKDSHFYFKLLNVQRILVRAPDIIKADLKSDLLRNRPDIVKQEKLIEAAVADIGIEKAALFPTISLTGNIGRINQRFASLGANNSDVTSYGAGLNWNLFSGTKQIAKIKIAKSRHKIALLNYRKSLLNASKEVDIALLEYKYEWQKIKQLKEIEQVRSEQLELAKYRHESGEEELLTLLASERKLLASQKLVIASRFALLSNSTKLYKSLGGGW